MATLPANTFEDFGTSGLTGDPTQWWPDEHGQPNPFFNYFRALQPGCDTLEAGDHREILRIISQQQKKPDASLLIDLFSLPADEGTKAKQKKQKTKEGSETDDDEIDIPKTLKRFVIDKRADGFVVRQGDPGAKRPPQLAIKVAYGVRRGSPFSKYNKADFRLGLGGIECTASGCDIVDFDENWMLVTVNEDAFEIAVTGFDTSHRDLHVDVRIKGDEDTVGQEDLNAPAPSEEELAHAATA